MALILGDGSAPMAMTSMKIDPAPKEVEDQEMADPTVPESLYRPSYGKFVNPIYNFRKETKVGG
jgi:hypothetical protein